MNNLKLVFEDHFDGDTLDSSVWTKEIGFLRTSEPQYFSNEPRNCFVKDSNLIIRTIREEYCGAHYTSASIVTAQKKHWMYGRFEMRAKLPRGRSLWPAFWTLGANFFDGVDWPKCGEIDIMEMTGGAGLRDYETIATLHWQSGKTGEHDQNGGHRVANDRPLCEDYHIYALEWTADKLVWFFDDQVIHESEITPDMQGAFNQPHFIILNTSLENWNEDYCPNDETPLPQDYIIDYVRVYQEDKEEIL